MMKIPVRVRNKNMQVEYSANEKKKVVCMVCIGCTTYSNSFPTRIHPQYLETKQRRQPSQAFPSKAFRQANNHLQDQSYFQRSPEALPSQSLYQRRSDGPEIRRRSFSSSDGNHDLMGKADRQKRVNVGIEVKLHPATKKYESDIEKLEDILAKALAGRLEEGESNSTSCLSCDEEEVPVKHILKPAYVCDEWNARLRICILERNIGDTVTFYLSTGRSNARQPNITWKKEFHQQNTAVRKEFLIDPENSPENIIIGRRGFELRVSPITETDLEYNMFSATTKSPFSSTGSKVFFMIRIVPIDLGFVYVGETIELNLRSHVSLPAKSMSFRWYMEKDGEHGTLPSNMKVSFTGGSIKISELRQEQEGILACSVYTNLDYLATKKRFLLKDLIKNNDVLKSSPNHTLIFKEEKGFRKRRDPKISFPMFASRVLSRSKRQRDLDIDIERALLETTTTDTQQLSFTTDIVPTRDDDSRVEVLKSYAHRKGNFAQDQGSQFEEFSDSVDNDEDSPKQVDISIDAGPQEVVESQNNERFQSPDRLLLQSDISKNGLNEPLADQLTPEGIVPENLRPYDNNQESLIDNRKNYLQTDNLRGNKNRYYTNKQLPASNILGKQTAYASNEIPAGNRLRNQNRIASNDFQSRFQVPSKINPGSIAQPLNNKMQNYIDVNMGTGKDRPPERNEQSEVIVNIDRIPSPRQIPAEEKIAKLISNCNSDFECSGTANCVRSSLKKPGFCKCLAGFYGVGIFCREATWLGSSKLEVDEEYSVGDNYFPDFPTASSEFQ